MVSKRTLIGVTATTMVAVFVLAAVHYSRRAEIQTALIAVESNELVRPHSPLIGPANAAVTIVEFFDPACESCRAFYPVVKQIMARYPSEVRLVLRYAALHQGSAEAVRILEAAREQKIFIPVLEALLEKQPVWADHRSPKIEAAWDAARAAGLDLTRARSYATRPELDALIQQDMADLRAKNVKGTPTFFVNGKPLSSFGPLQLAALVEQEVHASKPRP